MKKHLSTYPFLIFPFLILFSLFIYREQMNHYLTLLTSKQNSSQKQLQIEKSIMQRYDYVKSGSSYRATLLEFGAKGCYSCRKMETVMQELHTLYPDQLNVVFINLTLPENQTLANYYGISTIPAQILLDSTGTLFHRHSGYYSTQELISRFLPYLKP